MTAQEIKTTIIDQLNKVQVADRFVLVRFSSSMPKQQAVNQLVTAEIALQHGNHKRESKAIDSLYGDEFTALNSIIRCMRDLGKSVGFPYWQSGSLATGTSMLPVAAYGRFFERIQALNVLLSEEIERIASDWDGLLCRRSVALKGLFRPEQYPTAEQFKRTVQARYTVAPVPAGSALQRMVNDLTGDAAESLSKSIATVDDDQRKALAESLHKQMAKFAAECRNIEKVLSADKPRIFTTLYDDIRNIVSGLAGLGLPAIDDVVAPISDLVNEDPKDLCGETILQRDTADAAKQAADEADLIAQQLASML